LDDTHYAIGMTLILLSAVLVWLLITVWPSKQSLSARTLSNATLALAETNARLTKADSELKAAQDRLTDTQKEVPRAAEQASHDARVKALETQLAVLVKRKMDLEQQVIDNTRAQTEATQRLNENGTDAVLLTQWHALDRILGSNSELRLLILVIVSAALGSTIHAARSFAGFTGRQAYDHAWNWWYFLRIPTGIGIALLFYFLIRGGFFAAGNIDGTSVAETVNPFGVAAMSAVAGMFARQTSAKVEEIFLTLFRTSARGGGTDPQISVKRVQPVQTGATAEALKVAIEGRNFDKDVKVVGPDNLPRMVKVEPPGRMAVELLPLDVKTAGRVDLRIFNPPFPGGSTDTANVRIVDHVDWPNINAASAPATGDPAVLTVDGVNFDSKAEVLIGSTVHAATGTSAQLTVSVPRSVLGGTPKCRIRLADGQLSNEFPIRLT